MIPSHCRRRESAIGRIMPITTGNIMCISGFVPVLLLYLPYYLLTRGALQNYVAVLFFFAGFIIAAAGFVYELMKRLF